MPCSQSVTDFSAQANIVYYCLIKFRIIETVTNAAISMRVKCLLIVSISGEIGGQEEEQAAEYLWELNVGCKAKPVVAYIAGFSAPPGRRMGHAGAIISGGKGKAIDKMDALRNAGVTIVQFPTDIGRVMHDVMKRQRII
ncbi:hypothetical protein JTB14_025688 [Gonioctena quinquepunctata]|nr:hypothetical protein JTB14_025688 [Gonioctena quinquepunctata]